MTLQDAGASRPASDVRLQKLGEVFGRVRQLPATIANPEDIQRHARAMVVGEYLGASRGVGYLIAQSEGVFDTTGVFAAMAVLATGVLLVGNVVARLERRLLRWKPGQTNARLKTFA
jgi:hypothetical protein